MTRQPFPVIDGGTPEPDTERTRRLARLRSVESPGETLRCHRCTGSALIEVGLGWQVRKGNKRPFGATKQLVCALCLLTGEYVVVW